MSKASSSSYKLKSETLWRLYFTTKGAHAHEFYLARPGNAYAPKKCSFIHVADFESEMLADAFIDFCEGQRHMDAKLTTSYVRYSYANWKRYHQA
jgi:hypothetical protein